MGAEARAVSAGVAAGPVLTLAEAFSFAERLGLDPVDESGGVRTVSFPVELSRTPATTRLRPPELGEHDEAIRAFIARGR